MAAATGSGERNQNKSQFFITLRGDLDEEMRNKFSVFGRVVGGKTVLDNLNQTIEVVQTAKGGSKPKRPLTVMEVEIFSDPFRAYQKAIKDLEKEEQEEAAEKLRNPDGQAWFSNRSDPMRNHCIPDQKILLLVFYF